MPLTIGIDMGGTFVDCVVTGLERVVLAKAPTTEDDLASGIVAALEVAATDAGMSLEGLLRQASDVAHGTTLGVNALLARRGSRVGLLATRGHEDALLIGRVHQKVAGLRPHELMRASELRKPDPLVPRWAIRGIDERIDAQGTEVVALDEAGVATAAAHLLAAGCEVLAVAFLWSFRNPVHERRAAEIIQATWPGTALVLSSEIAPVLGEYERTAATVVNAFLVEPFAGYLGRLTDELRSRAFRGNVWIMGMAGGLIPAAVAAARPVETLRSGPVGGIIAAGGIGDRVHRRNVIATDMGGTSFDVGLVVDGRPQFADVTIAAQLHLALPTVEVRSIGAGGGSVAWLDGQGGLHVGPQSMGSNPGPACYGRGGTEPTVTDADAVLGRLDPDAVLGGRIRVDVGRAEAAIRRLADRLGVDVITAADGLVRVADAQMADLIRTVTIERGHDPRAFALVAFGGAGPLHVGRFGAEVGVAEAVIPPSASVLSALGLATADYRRTWRRSRRLAVPLDPAIVTALFDELLAHADAEFRATRLAGPLEVDRWIELRYRRQTHQLRVPLPPGPSVEDDLQGVIGEFERLYERTYGAGTAYAAAGIEATAIGLTVTAARGDAPANPPLPAEPAEPAAPARPAQASGRRAVWFDRWIETPVHSGPALAPGDRIDGPAVVDWPTTTLVVHPGQHALVGPTGDAHLRFAEASDR